MCFLRDLARFLKHLFLSFSVECLISCGTDEKKKVKDFFARADQI